MATQIFRKVSLERLSSPEQLDTLMQITTPKGWVALLALGGLLMCAVIWGIWGSISDKVMGQGILIKSGGVFNIVSNSTGRVQNLYVDVHDIVYRGQIVARLEQPEILDRIRNARASLNELAEKCDQIAKFGTKEMKLERESMAQQRSTLEQSITFLQGQVQWLQKKLENQK